MNVILSSAAILTIVFSASTPAQEAEHRLGEHPAVLVKRAAEKQAYDYAAKFYPHPAWMYLCASEPKDDPNANVARRETAPAEVVDSAVALAAAAVAARR